MANPTDTTSPATDKAPPAKQKPKGRRESDKLVHVLVNRESSIQIPTVREKDGSVNPDGILFLTSGWNLVDADKWAAARKNEGVENLLAAKIPPATSPEQSPEKVGQHILVEGRTVDRDNPLLPLSEPEALRFVSEVFQVPLLQQLLGQENRPTVLRALRGKIQQIESAKREVKDAKEKA